MRFLRRRLGLTQRELADLLGYDSDSYVSLIEKGIKTPHLAEVLIIELVFGVPAVTIFPQIREAVGEKVRQRAKLLLADLMKSCLSTNTRLLYKTARLQGVVASLGSRQALDQSDTHLWHTET